MFSSSFSLFFSFLSHTLLVHQTMQTKMVDVSLLSHAEIDWLNNYHAEVWEKVSPQNFFRLSPFSSPKAK